MARKQTPTKAPAEEGRYSYYMVIPEIDESGDKFKPMFSETIVFINEPASVVDNIHKNPDCRGIDPSSMGVYVVDMNDPESELKMDHLDARVRDESKPVIGPFTSITAGRKAVEDARENTRDETIAILTAKVATYEGSKSAPPKE